MHLCFVLLPDLTQLTQRALEKAFKEFPDLPKPKWRSQKKGDAQVVVDGLEIAVALLPAPVPDGEADHATERSLSGLDGTWTLPEHRAHLAVVCTGDSKKKKRTAVEGLTLFTRVVAAVTRATGAVGVYWGEASATHHPEFMVNIAQSELPLPIWVGVSIAQGKRGVELLSVGLQRQLGLPDLLLEAKVADGEALEFFYDLLAYVVRRGAAIPAGETVGRDEKEKLAVKYVKSPVEPSAEVWAVKLPRRKG
jgi:hypothetical protein